MSKLDDFDPNDRKSPQAPTWATYIPSRRTKPFKVYVNRGHALNAFQYQPDGILYEFVDGGWVERARLEGFQPADYCDDCGTYLLKEGYGGWRNNGYVKWVEQADGTLRCGTYCLTHVRQRRDRAISRRKG